MQIGERIKQARVHRGLTQRELGVMVGFDEKTADVRIAQYESATRTPKADMRNKLAEALGINSRYFFDSHQYAAEDIMFLLFELDDSLKLRLTTSERNKKVSIHIPNSLVDEFLLDWAEQKRMLADEEITKAEYTEWKLNWPKSAGKQKEEDQGGYA